MCTVECGIEQGGDHKDQPDHQRNGRKLLARSHRTFWMRKSGWALEGPQIFESVAHLKD